MHEKNYGFVCTVLPWGKLIISLVMTNNSFRHIDIFEGLSMSKPIFGVVVHACTVWID